MSSNCLGSARTVRTKPSAPCCVPNTAHLADSRRDNELIIPNTPRIERVAAPLPFRGFDKPVVVLHAMLRLHFRLKRTRGNQSKQSHHRPRYDVGKIGWRTRHDDGPGKSDQTNQSDETNNHTRQPNIAIVHYFTAFMAFVIVTMPPASIIGWPVFTQDSANLKPAKPCTLDSANVCWVTTLPVESVAVIV